MNLSALHGPAVEEFFKQPIVVLYCICSTSSMTDIFFSDSENIEEDIELELAGHLLCEQFLSLSGHF